MRLPASGLAAWTLGPLSLVGRSCVTIAQGENREEEMLEMKKEDEPRENRRRAEGSQ